MSDDLHTPEEIANRCFMVEDSAGRTIGYWRDETKARAKAREVGGEVFELFPPERIACEDDPVG